MAEPRASSTSYAMLGLLALRPWSAYELVQQSERSLRWFFPRSERAVYLDVKRLVKLGWAESESVARGKRSRTVYSITQAGREALAEWLETPSLPLQVESEAALKAFYGDLAPLATLRGTLEQARAAADANLRRLAEMAVLPSHFPKRMPTNTLCLRFLVEINLAVERWAEWAEEALGTLETGDQEAIETRTRAELAAIHEIGHEIGRTGRNSAVSSGVSPGPPRFDPGMDSR